LNNPWEWGITIPILTGIIMTGIIEKIKKWFIKIADVNVCTTKESLIAFLQALKNADKDGNKNLTVSETAKLYVEYGKDAVIRTSMSKDEAIAIVTKMFEE